MNAKEFNSLKKHYEEKIRLDLQTGAIKVNKDGNIKKSMLLPRDINSGKSRRIQAEGKTVEECAENLAKKYRKVTEKTEDLMRFKTFREVAEEWYDIEIRHASISDANKKNYKTDLYLHILPALGNLDITQLYKKDYQEFLNDFEGKGQSMVKKIRMTVLRIVKYAMENQYMTERLISLKLPATVPIKKRDILSEQLIKLLFKVQKTYSPAIVFLAMLVTGMRPCELYGLKYIDIDFVKKIFYINKSKTENGIRTIPVPDFILKLIIQDKKKLEKQGLNPTYVFHQQVDPLKPHNADTLIKTWKTTLREMDILNGATLHRNKIIKSTIPNKDTLNDYSLRHTYCTMLNDCEIGSYYKKRLMGHTLKDSVTDGVYTHTTEEKIIKAAKPFINYIEKLYAET